jgi:flagellar basal body rod protein FlgC
VVQQSNEAGGTSATVRRAPVPGEALAQDMVEQISAGYNFVANLKVIEADKKMMGTLLDARA